MSKPIVIIDDDADDVDLLTEIIHELDISNEVYTFSDSESSLEFFRQSGIDPLFIICDISMPRINGLELRLQMLSIDSVKNAPFIFYSTSSARFNEINTEKLKIAGFYQKALSYAGIKQILTEIRSIADCNYSTGE